MRRVGCLCAQGRPDGSRSPLDDASCATVAVGPVAQRAQGRLLRSGVQRRQSAIRHQVLRHSNRNRIYINADTARSWKRSREFHKCVARGATHSRTRAPPSKSRWTGRKSVQIVRSIWITENLVHIGREPIVSVRFVVDELALPRITARALVRPALRAWPVCSPTVMAVRLFDTAMTRGIAVRLASWQPGRRWRHGCSFRHTGRSVVQGRRVPRSRSPSGLCPTST